MRSAEPNCKIVIGMLFLMRMEDIGPMAGTASGNGFCAAWAVRSSCLRLFRIG